MSIKSFFSLALPVLSSPSQGFRLGIDISLWLFHTGYSKGEENPELRLIFFCCCSLLKYPILSIFIFDSLRRPEWKRGKKINRSPAKLITAVKVVVEAFGFKWRMAPGEAEAELAYLNEAGIIDGILTDDVDTFIFGAHTVIWNLSSTHPHDDKLKQHFHVYSEIQQSRADLLLIALCSGGDYYAGLQGCGVKTALALVQCGFADSLYHAATSLPPASLSAFLCQWCNEVISELATDLHGCIGRKMTSLVLTIPQDFPNIHVLSSYVQPITPLSEGHPDFYANLIWMEKEPLIPEIAQICEFYFKWGFEATILKWFHNILWPSITFWVLCWQLLSPEDTFLSQFVGDLTQSVTEDFSDWVTKIHSTWKHFSTDYTPEYHIEIKPSVLSRIAETEVQGICRPDDIEWEGSSEDGDRQDGDDTTDPQQSSLCVWVPVVLMKQVYPELVEEHKGKEWQKDKKKKQQGRLEVIVHFSTPCLWQPY